MPRAPWRRARRISSTTARLPSAASIPTYTSRPSASCTADTWSSTAHSQSARAQ